MEQEERAHSEPLLSSTGDGSADGPNDGPLDGEVARASRRSSAPVLYNHRTQPGEFRNDTSDPSALKITRATKRYAFCAALNSCNLGYDIGANAGAGMLVQDSLGLTDVQLQFFIGSLDLFAMAGALSSNWISDRLGRRMAFIVAAVGFIIGTIIQCCAYNYTVLMIGRVFTGLGVGFGLAADPVYISEISQAAHRGQLVTWSEFGINAGIVLGFLAGLAFSQLDDDLAWRLIYAFGAVLPCVVIYLASCVMPESPRWLVLKEREEEAATVLKEVYPEGYDVNVIVEEMRETLRMERAAEHASGWNVILFPTPAFKRMLLVGVGVAIAQQAAGIDAIGYYTVFILDEVGITSQEAKMGILSAIGVMRLCIIVLAGYWLDRQGRRPAFFVSLLGMAVALIIVSLSFIGQWDTSHMEGIAVFGLTLYFAFFSVGMGPGAWLIPSEIFPTMIRAKGMSVAAFMNRLTATVMSSTFLSVANAITWSAFFLLLALVCVIIFVWMYFYVPETKGRSLEDMSQYFAEITGDRSILEAEQMLHSQPDDGLVDTDDQRRESGDAQAENEGVMA